MSKNDQMFTLLSPFWQANLNLVQVMTGILVPNKCIFQWEGPKQLRIFIIAGKITQKPFFLNVVEALPNAKQ